MPEQLRYRQLDQETAEVIYNGRKYHVSVGGWWNPDDADSGGRRDSNEDFLGIDIDGDDITTPSGREIKSSEERREVAEAVAHFYRSAGINARIG